VSRWTVKYNPYYRESAIRTYSQWFVTASLLMRGDRGSRSDRGLAPLFVAVANESQGPRAEKRALHRKVMKLSFSNSARSWATSTKNPTGEKRVELPRGSTKRDETPSPADRSRILPLAGSAGIPPRSWPWFLLDGLGLASADIRTAVAGPRPRPQPHRANTGLGGDPSRIQKAWARMPESIQ
jgi:hypothetical protein